MVSSSTHSADFFITLKIMSIELYVASIPALSRTVSAKVWLKYIVSENRLLRTVSYKI